MIKSGCRQRWKKLWIVQIYPCHFFLVCANFWLYSRKLAKNTVLGCAKGYFKNLAIFYAFFHVWLQLDQKAFA